MPKLTREVSVAGLTVLLLGGGTAISYHAVSTDNSTPLRQFQTLTADERKILALPKSNAQAKIDNFDLIKKTARSSSVLLIHDCAVRPVVIKLGVGQALTFKNLDQVPHIIDSDLAHEFRVPAQGELSTKVDLGHGAGLYSIECDHSGKLSGIFYFGLP